MAGRLIRTALRSAVNQVRHVTPVHPRRATGLTAEVYRQLERDFGMLAPPVALHAPAPATMAAAWAMLRETLVVTTSVPRATKEAVATGVSLANACPYCVQVHTATLGGLDAAHGATSAALAAGDLDGVTDESTRAVAGWARDSATLAGAAGRSWPFPAEHAAQLVGVAVAFHYLNRMVHVFLGESPLPPHVPAGVRGTADRFLGRVMRGPALRLAEPGDALALLAPAPPADDLAWAVGERRVAEAFAAAAGTIESAARASVPAPVRELVAAEVSTWDGRPPGLSRAWVADAVAPLVEEQRPAARLALLVAKAAYQVDDEVVAAYRRRCPAEADLVELVSWASLTTARRVGAWLGDQRPGTAPASAA